MRQKFHPLFINIICRTKYHRVREKKEMKLSYVFGIASAQNPLTMQYRVERYQTQHRISGRAKISFILEGSTSKELMARSLSR